MYYFCSIRNGLHILLRRAQFPSIVFLQPSSRHTGRPCDIRRGNSIFVHSVVLCIGLLVLMGFRGNFSAITFFHWNICPSPQRTLVPHLKRLFKEILYYLIHFCINQHTLPNFSLSTEFFSSCPLESNREPLVVH